MRKKKDGEYYSEEMESAVDSYVETVGERFMAALSRTPDAILKLEEQLDFSEWVPDGYGTGDVVIIADGVLDIIDLKYGKGVPVSAIGNSQMKLYALGAWSAYSFLYDIREIHMTIVQPRLDSVSTDTITVDELLEWAESVVKPAAALADAGEGETKPGEHCRWCKVKATCRARADESMSVLAHEFQDPRLMTLEEIGNIMYILEQMKSWAKDVEEFAYEQAKNGTAIPRWKMVEGRSDRKIADIEAAKAKLIEAGFEESKLLKDPVLRGIGELEKLVGKKKFAELLEGIVIKPPGKPALVPETDPRPQMNSVENDFAGEEFN